MKTLLTDAGSPANTSGRTASPFRALIRIVGVSFALSEPYEAWVAEGEQVASVSTDWADRGYWITCADGSEVLVARDPSSDLVSEQEWLALQQAAA